MLYPSLTRLALALPLFDILLVLFARCALCFILPFFMFEWIKRRTCVWHAELTYGASSLLSIITQILEQDPTYPEALIGRGTALAFQRELDAAISDFTKVCIDLAI